ncbi:MAG: molecular chaperone DnaJ [Acidobacteria bacterium RIFCSPLOWO2_02_FULL_59_13]|nr:MAG: molecular chaperone DnaJ [Acidobacteria bacterium RIFCSPLOWO2_02_FULL_59_13]
MTGKDDYYRVLGVERKATAAEIRKAYRRLARKYHPDLNPGDKSAEERFKKISEANDILSDPKKRQMYDRVGYYSESGPPGGGPQPERPVDFSGFDFSDWFSGPGAETGTGGFRDVFSQYFGRGHPESAGPERGSDLEYQVSIGFWEAIRGATARLNVMRYKTCPVCHGIGNTGKEMVCPECRGTGHVTKLMSNMRFNVTCARCKGAGKVKDLCTACGGESRRLESESLEVRVPAGVQDGYRVRVAGKGHAGKQGGPNGDLYIITKVGAHPFFERRGDDIYTVLPVTITEATLGAKVEVPTIDQSRALLKIPPGTPSGQKFRLREKGVSSLKTGQRGDQYVEVRIQVPQVHDERSKEILRELARLNPQDPRADLYRQ